ncbi:MAG: DUF882 domain-containing protein [Steroidobacteraceae bacterium]
MSRQTATDAACPCGSRRRFLARLIACLPAAATARAAWAADETVVARELQLVNTHTGEVLDTRFFKDGAYDPEQLGRLDWLLRDYRTSEVLPIDTRLFDLLCDLAQAAGREPRYEIISGYRSPATNAMLVATTDGVSSHSLHMEGRAIDVRLVGLPTRALRDLALARQVGGVGYYPVSDFVHLDTGRARNWSG